MQVYLVLALIFMAGIGVFIYQNPDPVMVQFLNWHSPKVSLAMVALTAACAGALVVFLIDGFRYYKLAKKSQQVKRDNRRMMTRLDALKSEKGGHGVKTEGEKTHYDSEHDNAPSDSE